MCNISVPYVSESLLDLCSFEISIVIFFAHLLSVLFLIFLFRHVCEKSFNDLAMRFLSHDVSHTCQWFWEKAVWHSNRSAFYNNLANFFTRISTKSQSFIVSINHHGDSYHVIMFCCHYTTKCTQGYEAPSSLFFVSKMLIHVSIDYHKLRL